VAALARIAVAAPLGAATDQVNQELTDRAQQEQRARQTPPTRPEEAQSQTDKERVSTAPGRDKAASVGSVNQASSRIFDPQATEGQGLARPWVIQFWVLAFSMLRSKRMTPRPRVQYYLICLASLGLALVFTVGSVAGFTVGSAYTHEGSWASQMFGWFAALCYIWAFVMFGRAAFRGRARRWFWRLPPPWLDTESSGAPIPKPVSQKPPRR
jgi:hypothetical protein